MSDPAYTIKPAVEKFCSDIMEHVDSVQVFVTFHQGGEETTKTLESGKGNFYARQGQIDEWLRIQHQYQRNYAVRKDAEE